MLKEKLQTFLNLPQAIERELQLIHTRASAISSLVAQVLELQKRPERHFVQILIFGNLIERPASKPFRYVGPGADDSIDEYGGISQSARPPEKNPETYPSSPCSLADSAYVRDHEQYTFSFQPFMPLVNPKIIVVCDTSRIRIESIKCANQDLNLSMENAPVSFYKGRVGPENRITVVVSSRTR